MLQNTSGYPKKQIVQYGIYIYIYIYIYVYKVDYYLRWTYSSECLKAWIVPNAMNLFYSCFQSSAEFFGTHPTWLRKIYRAHTLSHTQRHFTVFSERKHSSENKNMKGVYLNI